MKVPTLGTSVFEPVAYSGNNAAEVNVTSAVNAPSFSLTQQRNNASWQNHVYDRLRGNNKRLRTSSTGAEVSANGVFLQNGITLAASDDNNTSGVNYINYFFQRAPSFFDEVCYTGDGSNPLVLNHNLGAVPDMIIVKSRSAVGNWWSYQSALGKDKYILLNTSSLASTNADSWGSSGPTSTQFTVNFGAVNTASVTYVAYLFATCAGVSKVFSYTGNGSSQTINCGFTAGSRFVMIKRTDSTGDWYVWDSARGIVAGNDPHLSLNDTAAEVTTDDSVDTDNTGFIVNQLAATNVNVTSATYIGLAIA